MVEINLNNVFYLTQYIQNNTNFNNVINAKTMNETVCTLFSVLSQLSSDEPQVQVLQSHVWPVATILDSADLSSRYNLEVPLVISD